MNPRIFRRIAAACCGWVVLVFVWPAISSADISLPKIFSDHMVLQRDSNVKVWGKSEAGQKLTVTFNGQEAKATANSQGAWSVTITTEGPGGPYVLEIVAEEGDPKVVFADVMVGEVWLCAGQCNMQSPVSSSLNAENEIELSKKFPNIRLFTVGQSASPQPLDAIAEVIPWTVCSPESVKEFSATAYYFGRELSKELSVNEELKNISIGLIDASWQGTFCEAWASRESLSEVKELAPLLQYWDENDEPQSINRPGGIFNAMIAPITKFPIRGVIWYQGEANKERGYQYQFLFPTLIKDWRKQFGSGDLPFYFVQLAPFRYENKSPELLAEIRDAQLKTLSTVPNTRMIVTTDIGDLADINPKNKQVVGRRLAIAALTDVYAECLPEEKKSLEYIGPVYESMVSENNRILVKFKHAEGGLKIDGDESELSCFTICGEDRVFFPATAIIRGDQLEVSSPDVEHPIAVRFAWNDSAQPNFVNAQGLPASPFRTDDFPLISVGRDF